MKVREILVVFDEMSIWERSQHAMAAQFSQSLHEKQKTEENSDSESDTELPDLSKSEADLKLEQVIFLYEIDPITKLKYCFNQTKM